MQRCKSDVDFISFFVSENSDLIVGNKKILNVLSLYDDVLARRRRVSKLPSFVGSGIWWVTTVWVEPQLRVFQTSQERLHFLAGYGPYRVYLCRFHLRNNNICKYEETESPDHVVPYCPDLEDQLNSKRATIWASAALGVILSFASSDHPKCDYKTMMWVRIAGPIHFFFLYYSTRREMNIVCNGLIFQRNFRHVKLPPSIVEIILWLLFSFEVCSSGNLLFQFRHVGVTIVTIAR